MKEEVKSEILRRMLPYLNNEQLSALENAIDSALKNADVIETPDKPQEEDHSLDSFLTAKRIEDHNRRFASVSDGLSDRTTIQQGYDRQHPSHSVEFLLMVGR